MVQQADPQIALQKAAALHEAGRYRAAATAFEQLADRDGCRAAAHLGWGRALSGLDNIKEAASHFAAAIDADPGDPDAYSELHDIWERLESPDELLARIRRRIANLSSAPAHAALAAFLTDLDRKDAAQVEHARAAELEPKNARLAAEWAVALDASGRHDDAVRQCEIAIALINGDLGDTDPFAPLASALRALDAPDDAVARVQKVVDASDNAEIRLRWAGTLYAVGRAADGARVFENVATVHPARRVEALLAWARELESAGDAQTAQIKIVEAITLDPARDDGYRALAGLANLSELAADGLTRIEQLVKSSDSAAALVWWATLLRHLKRHAEAVQAFEAAFQLSAQPVDQPEWFHHDWADSLETLGRFDASVDHWLTGFAMGEHSVEWSQHSFWLKSQGLSPVFLKLTQSHRDFTRLQARVDALEKANVYAAWAQALEQSGETDAAISQYRKAAATDPQDIGSVAAASQLLAKQGRHREAVLEYQCAIEQQGADAVDFEPLLVSLRQVDDATRATLIAGIQGWVDTGNNAEARLRWGKALLELGRPADAVREHEASVKLDPDNPHALVACGLALDADGKPARALTRFAIALAVGAGEPNSLKAALDGFKAAFLKAGSDEALAKVNTSIEAIDGAWVYWRWAQTLGALGRAGAELANYRRAFDKHGTHADLCVEYGYRLVDAGRIDEGLALLRSAAEREPPSAYVQGIWGQSLLRTRRREEAIERFRNAIEIGDAEGNYQFDWAIALGELGSDGAAIEKYCESIKRADDPINTAFCRHNIASLLERQGDFLAAGKAWDDALQAYADATASALKKSNADFFYYRGSIYHEAKQDFDAAEAQYKQALALQPGDPNFLAAVARLYRLKIDHLSADATQSEQATEFHWKAWEAYENGRKTFERRIADLATAPLLVKLGKLHHAMADHVAARTSFARALDIEKDSPEAWDLLASAHLGAEDFKAALQPARTAVAIEPHNLGFRTTLADVYQKLNSLAMAEVEYKKVLAVAPNHVDASIGLGNTYVALGEELQKNGKASDAENMFLRALDQFTLSIGVEGKDRGSRRLSPAERAALSYSRGYANVMCYEAQTLAKRNEKLLQAALSAFDAVPNGDANFHKAQRAKQKITERTQPSERSARWGAWIIVFGAFVTFVVANVAFLIGKPGLVATFQVTTDSLQEARAVKLPDEVIVKLAPLAQRGPAPKAAFDSDLRLALGDDLAKKFGDAIREHAAAGPTLRWQESLEAGYYALLSFGALMFVVAGLYLQQLSKLKFGGIELEKTSETTTKVTGPLGITK
jgi:tetratricopeptide (TPR) repeat protein